MLQLQVIRDQTQKVLTGLNKRNFKDAESLIARVIETDKQRREAQRTLDDIKAKSNSESKKIGELMKSGKNEEAVALRTSVSADKDRIKELEAEMTNAEAELQRAALQDTQCSCRESSAGKSAEDNITVNEWGKVPTLPADAQPHWELIKKYDIIDFELGVKISGAGFPVYKGKGARLQRALINFFLDEAIALGYREIQPPIVINEASGYGTGQLPDKDGQMYYASEDKLYLIPTAEVPITNLYRDMVLGDDDIPVKNVGYTPCFRREAGSWGAHVRGLNRLHQFDKVEIVRIARPEESYNVLEEMCVHVQGLLEKLELPYRRLLLCGGDMGTTSAMTYDMEVYSAAQQRWLEVSSVSNFETYQANRLKLRHKGKDGKVQLLHTLNGSALALPRIVAAILENNQSKDGIIIPKLLRPYTGFDLIS